MGTKAGGNSLDLWSEIVDNENPEKQNQPKIDVVYRRIRPQKASQVANLKQPGSSLWNGNRVSLATPIKRVSWNSLSTRGRTSIAVGACVDYQPQAKHAKRKGKPALPKHIETTVSLSFNTMEMAKTVV